MIIITERENRETDGTWQYIADTDFYKYDCGQWRFIVEEEAPGKWYAAVMLGDNPSYITPIRNANHLTSLSNAKRWCVKSLHEIALRMLDIPIPAHYEFKVKNVE